MLGTLFRDPVAFLIGAFALLVAVTIHEFSHAFVAENLGDPTPRLKGRLTLNPLAHLDPIGTIMLLVAGFGWGKPVPIDPFNLREPKKDSALISLAGPISNLLLAFILSSILRLTGFPAAITGLFVSIIYLNVALAVFNLLPIHPLDGFKIVEGILPDDLSRTWASLQSMGMLILIFLLLPGPGGSVLTNIITPPINFLLKLLLPGSGSLFI